MRRLGLAVAALLSSGCFDFSKDLAACQDSGHCARPAGDAGPFFSVTPVFTTSAGWGWEFPFPAGPGLHSVVALGDDEAWAIGDDDTVLHVEGSRLTYSRLAVASANLVGNVCVLRVPDGGLYAFDEAALYEARDGGWRSRQSGLDLKYATACEVGTDGTPWFGGQAQPSAGACSPTGAAVSEGVPLPAPVCLAGGDQYVRGLDPEGWALVSDGTVLRRSAQGSPSWSAVTRSSRSDYNAGDVLALPDGRVLVVGDNGGLSQLLELDGGATPVTFPITEGPESWTALLRATDGDFYLGGRPGVLRCSLADPTNCQHELTDSSESIEALALGPTTVLAVGDNGQFVRREASGSWTTLHAGGAGSLNDVWAEPNGELWAVSENGWVLHRTESGWERQRVATTRLKAIRRTSDGLLWIVGDELIGQYDPAQHTLTPAQLLEGNGLVSLTGTGVSFTTLSGSEPGNTWAGGTRTLVGYGADGQWRRVPVSGDGGNSITQVWVTDAGTAWAVGGYESRVAMYFDGSTWTDRSPPGTGELAGVWGPSPTEVFVAGAGNSGGAHFLPDGAVEEWNIPIAPPGVSGLTGALTRDGGFVLFGLHASLVSRSPRGGLTTMLRPNAPADGYPNRITVIGDRVFVVGARDTARSFILSLDAGL